MSVYKSINAVQTELAKIGISKNSHNSQGAGYNFRGIDAVYNVLSSIMAKNGLVIIPRMISRSCEERQTKSGGAIFYVTVEAEFDLVCAEDGSKHTAKTFGEAMDTSDKATNKAMSAAYKYMAFQTFAIPTQGDNDADAHTHEVEAKKVVHAPTGTPIVNGARLGVIQAVAEAIKEHHAKDDMAGAFEEYEGITDEEERVALWKLLPSNVRSDIKKFGQSVAA